LLNKISGTEDRETYSHCLHNFSELLDEITTHGLHVGGRRHRALFKFVSDLKTFWALFGIDGDAVCPYCKETKETWLTHKGTTWSRTDVPSSKAILQIAAKAIVFCVLHARMRMVEQFMEILTARLKDERNGLAPLYSTMEELGIPFEIYDDPKQKDHWRLRSFSGNQAERIIENLESLTRLWPSYSAKNYNLLPLKELKEKCKKKGLATSRPLTDEELAAQSANKKRRRKALNKPEIVAILKERRLKKMEQSPPSIPETQTFTEVWTTLFRLYNVVSYGAAEGDDILEKWDEVVLEWKTKFDLLHMHQSMRVYPHIILDHGKDLLLEHGPLAVYSQQGFEAGNKRDVHNFHPQTSQCGGSLKKKEKENMTRSEQKGQLTLRTYSFLVVQPYLQKQNNNNIAEARDEESRKRAQRIKANAQKLAKKRTENATAH
jgi:hypothetical protein